jgi:hypothetical protein
VRACKAGEEAGSLRAKIAGLSRLWIALCAGDDRPSAMRLGPKALRLLESLPLNSEIRQYPAAHDPSSSALLRWQLCASSLLANAEAKLEVD